MSKLYISHGKRASQKHGWQTSAVTLASFVDSLTKHRTVKKKDGVCFLAGRLSGDERKATAVTQVSALVYDVDGGGSFEEIKAAVEARGCTGILYTTFSHRKATTNVNVDSYKKWAEKENAPFPPDLESILRFVEVIYPDATIRDAVFDLQGDRDKHFVHDINFNYVIHHAPVDRVRVVIPLAKPIIVAELGGTFSEASYMYKVLYNSVGTFLGIPYDRSGASLEHMFYFPGSPEGSSGHQAAAVNWDKDDPEKNLLRWEDVPRVSLTDPVDKQLSPASRLVKGVVTDKAGVRIDLERWTNDNPQFDMEELLKAKLPEDHILAERSSGEGYHIKCPHEVLHTSPGGLGTYVVNGDGDIPWVIHCVHNSCKTIHQIPRWGHLAALVNEGYITAKDLGIVSTIVVQEPEKKALNILADLTGGKEAPVADRSQFALDVPVDYNDRRYGTYEDEGEGEDDDTSHRPDSILETQEAYREYASTLLTELASVKSPKRFSKLLIELSHRAGDEAWVREYTGALGEVIANTGLTYNNVAYVLRSVSKASAIDTEGVLSAARVRKQQILDLGAALQTIISQRITGLALDEEISRIANALLQPKTVIQKALDDLGRDYYIQEFGENIADALAALDRQYGKLLLGASCYWLDIPATKEKVAPVLLTNSAMLVRFKNKTAQVVRITSKGAKASDVNLIDVWQKTSVRIKEFSGLTFDPRAPEITNDNLYNIWNPAKRFGTLPIEGDASPIVDHIREVWASNDTDKFNWIMCWLAHIIQRPGEKVSSALVLTGREGTGKSMVVEHALGPMLGPALWGMSSDKEHIIGKFNSHLETKLLWLAEECMFGQDRHAMQKLKDRISASTISIEPKGMAVYQVPNFTRYIFTSNALHSLALARGDRRFFVVECSPKYVGDKAYFHRLMTWLQQGGVGRFLWYLLHFKPESVGLTWQDMNYAPMTKEKLQQQQYSQSPSDAFFHTLLKYGCLPTMDDGPNMISWPLTLDEQEDVDPRIGARYYVSTSLLRRAFADFVTSTRTGARGMTTASFELAFEQTFGCDMRDYLMKGQKGTTLALPARIEVLKRLVDEGRFLQSDIDIALANPDSHLGVMDSGLPSYQDV